MNIQQTKLFAKQKKKLHAHQIKKLDEAVRTIAKDPNIGIQKKGDLNFVRVYKFKTNDQELLLAYQAMETDKLILLSLGSYENFYRDLKRVLRVI